MHKDRIRAKPPVRNKNKWQKGEIIDTKNNSKVIVRSSKGSEFSLEVTESLYQLFSSRMDGEILGGTVWFQKKE